jgi:hypothetical protein
LLTYTEPVAGTFVKRAPSGFRAPNGATFGTNRVIFNGAGETGENWCKSATATPAGSASKPFRCGPADPGGGDPEAPEPCIIEGNPTGPAPPGKGYRFYCTAEIQGRCGFSGPEWTPASTEVITRQPISCGYTTTQQDSCGPGMAAISPVHCGLDGRLHTGCCDRARKMRCTFLRLDDLATACN